MTRRAVLRWAWNHGPMTVLVLVLLALLGGTIAGEASNAGPVKPGPLPAVQDPEAAAKFHDSLAAVLADQRKADKARREAWIADGYSHDLAELTEDSAQLSGDDGSLDGDAQQFGYDAQAYLDAAGNTAVRPPPGWQPKYAQLRAELNQLAADEGMAPVPAPHGAISGAPGPDAPIWEPSNVPNASACTPSGTTVTNSSSSSGATSHSVKAKTTCGTGSTSVTNKTSVSAKGVVTHSTTTTTSNGSSGSSSGG